MRSFRFRPSQFARSLADSLRKHPFLLALRPQRRRARRNGCFRRLVGRRTEAFSCEKKTSCTKGTSLLTEKLKMNLTDHTVIPGKFCLWNMKYWALKSEIQLKESGIPLRGGSRILFRRGCTHLLLYVNTNKPHSFFFWQNTSCIRKPQVISGGVRTPCTLPLDPPLPLKMESRIEVPLKKKNRNPVPGIWNPWLGIQNLRLSWIEKKKRHVSSLVSLLSLLFVRSHYLEWFSGPLDINFIGL